MKSETGIRSLAEIGEWPNIEIGSHSVIRHAYENVLNACARLASFSTGRPTTTDGPISGKQVILARDDLVSFAIHARRLIENTGCQKRFSGVTLRVNQKGIERDKAIWRVINILVHHKEIEIVRNLFDLELLSSRFNAVEALIRYGTEETHKYNKQFPPLVFVSSDRPKFSFRLQEMVEMFQSRLLNPMIELCAEHRLYLDLDDEL